MDIPLLVAVSLIFGMPIIILVGAALFPREPEDPYASAHNWGSQDIDQNLNK